MTTGAADPGPRPSLGRAGWLLVLVLLLNVVGPALTHVGWFTESCAGWEGHGLLDHYDRTQAGRLLPAASLVLLLARHHWAVLTCSAWAGWIVLTAVLSVPALLSVPADLLVISIGFLLAKLAVAWFAVALPRDLRRRGVLG